MDDLVPKDSPDSLAAVLTAEQRRQITELEREFRRIFRNRPVAGGIGIIALERVLGWVIAQTPDARQRDLNIAAVVNTLPLYVNLFTQK